MYPYIAGTSLAPESKEKSIDMNDNEQTRLINFIEQVPVVGQFWADAVTTWLSLGDALNLSQIREETVELGGPNVVDLKVPAPLEPAQQAA